MITKDFQEATAERILQIYKEQNQNRVLLADEVGLGKTIVARAVVQKLSEWHAADGDDHFKVIYVCSNANIANQNGHKLGIRDEDCLKINESRLSMQHLKIYQSQGKDHSYQQLIPLTPATSFTMSGGQGIKSERALIFVLLKKFRDFSKYRQKLSQLMKFQEDLKDWEWYISQYETIVYECNADTGTYIKDITEAMEKYISEDLYKELLGICSSESVFDFNNAIRKNVINRLRRIFAQISLDKLDPDFVIMDEFQRFKDLITPSDDESGMLSKRFLMDSKTKVLLLSATPYKPYSTLEELSLGDDGHYDEFVKVIDFLLYDPDKNRQFKEVWSDFSNHLSELKTDDITILVARKKPAEDSLYECMCRSERRNEGMIDDGKVAEIRVTSEDILSFVEIQRLLNELCLGNFPIEYVKSAPYLLSFMNYKIKDRVVRELEKKQDYSSIKASKNMLLQTSNIKTYNRISPNNARLQLLEDEVFGAEGNQNNAELLLWIPPSKPYYQTDNVFSKNTGYSKLLVFSSWEMVPRMIAGMVSYESERLNIVKLNQKDASKKKKYFAEETKKRNVVVRLRDDMEEILTYPSRMLANLWDPIEYAGQSIDDIRSALLPKINQKIEEISREYGIQQGHGGAKQIIELLKAIEGRSQNGNLQVIPPGAADLLTNMALGSPGVCALRIFDNEGYAADLAKSFVSLFNKQESMAVVDVLYGKDEAYYYEDVIRYCAEGNLQAVLEEFAFVLGSKGSSLLKSMKEAFIGTASVQIDTKESLINHRAKSRLRTHFAVGYYNAQVNEKSIQRTEHIRTAFNSPFRPFVLATTSIGQEGLDFHCYCRKIMHWNLPSNPVDLEQREGRINRYLCLAIRQNIAGTDKFSYSPFEDDVWEEMLCRAKADLQGNNSELVPFWCLPNDFKFKYRIERIVPMYPFSRDKLRYERLIKVLSLYRLTLGQPRQEELFESLEKRDWSSGDLDELYINLSPFSKNQKL